MKGEASACQHGLSGVGNVVHVGNVAGNGGGVRTGRPLEATRMCQQGPWGAMGGF